MTRSEIDCPRCGKPVPPDRDWCLNCGAAARTRLVGSPRWKLPVAAMAVVAALSLAAIAVAFVSLTDDPDPPKVYPDVTVKTVPTPGLSTTTQAP